MRRAAVTGGAGFIGSNLVDRLLGGGWSVAAIDGFDNFYPRERKMRHLALASGHAQFTLIEADTRDRESIRAALATFRPSVVFDLAARGGVRPSIADPATYIDINVRGLQNTLSAVAEQGARLIFASSSSVYGDDPQRPYHEDQARGRPVSPYGATKVAGEALIHAHHALTGLPVGIARLFTVYGPRQRPDLAIMTFAQRILDRQPIDLFGNGRGVRDFTFVDDAVDALMRMADAPDESLTVNVGSHHPVETLAVVAALERALGMPAERRLLPPQPGDVEATHADISRARDALGWEPRVPFEEGIERFCRWLLAEAMEPRAAGAGERVESGQPPESA
jgi:UDP-glucuronate 4-epimerase